MNEAPPKKEITHLITTETKFRFGDGDNAKKCKSSCVYTYLKRDNDGFYTSMLTIRVIRTSAIIHAQNHIYIYGNNSDYYN